MCCFGFCTIRQWRWWVLKLLRFCEFCWMTLHKMLDQIVRPFHRHENGGVRNDDDYSNKLKTNQHTTLLCVFSSCIYNPFSESIHFIANIEREKGVSRDKRERGTWKPSVVVMPSTRQVLMIKMLRAIWPFIQLQTVFPLPPKIWGYCVCGFHEPNSNRFEYMLQQHQPIWILWMIECNRTAVQ